VEASGADCTSFATAALAPNTLSARFHHMAWLAEFPNIHSRRGPLGSSPGGGPLVFFARTAQGNTRSTHLEEAYLRPYRSARRLLTDLVTKMGRRSTRGKPTRNSPSKVYLKWLP
jgi:hypothetical protein